MNHSVLINKQHQLGEGPVWDERAQSLWYTDINAGKIYAYFPSSDDRIEHDIGTHVGAVGLCEDDRLVLATADGFIKYNPKSRQTRELKNPLYGRSHLRFNDGKPDPSGSFFAGTMAYDAKEAAGTFYRLTPQNELHTVLDNVTISNGLAWNGDETRLYYIDTTKQAVTVFDYNKNSGAATHPRKAFAIPDKYGSPDGMTIDSEDKLWIAHYGGSAVRRFDPESGALLATIELPVSNVTCCTFGGADFDTLFITTAAQGLSDEELAERPLSGAIFAVKPGQNGRPVYRFKG